MNNRKIKVCHLTSAHPRYDTRIFLKQCLSLSNADYDVTLIVADGKGDEVKNGIKILDVGKENKRLNRILKSSKKVVNKAVGLECDIYQLHDPELLPLALKLKNTTKSKVVFDSHEDVPKQFLYKPYLNKFFRNFISKCLEKYEKRICRKLDYIITATPFIREKFLMINDKTIDVNNYPKVDELLNNQLWSNRENKICYVGTIETVRGIKEMVKAMEYTNKGIVLNLGGAFISDELDVYEEVKKYEGWKKVNELGFLSRDSIKEMFLESKVGLVLLHPIVNYLDSLPVKMFEYMASGIPVLASNIPLWKEIIHSNNCGLTADPMNPKDISQKINMLIENDELSKRLGDNGKKAVLEKYNWSNEEKKMLGVYKYLLSS